MAIPGTRGNTGKRTINVDTSFYKLFDTDDFKPVESKNKKD
jgi:hypothetical protein